MNLNSNQAGLLKVLINVVVSASIGTVVNNFMSMNTPDNLSTVNKVMTKIGGVVISSMVSTAGTEYVYKSLNIIETPVEEPAEQPKAEEQESEQKG